MAQNVKYEPTKSQILKADQNDNRQQARLCKWKQSKKGQSGDQTRQTGSDEHWSLTHAMLPMEGHWKLPKSALNMLSKKVTRYGKHTTPISRYTHLSRFSLPWNVQKLYKYRDHFLKLTENYFKNP